ncbi:MAG: hypothetical protein QM681_17420 [Novosphingobium sp.]
MVDWWAVFTAGWGLAAGPVGFYVGRRNKRNDALPNVRMQKSQQLAGFYYCIIEVQPRTNEDLTITEISAPGEISLSDDFTAEYDDGGSLLSHERIYRGKKRAVHLVIPYNAAGHIEIYVQNARYPQVDLKISSSARTLRDKVIRVAALQPE